MKPWWSENCKRSKSMVVMRENVSLCCAKQVCRRQKGGAFHDDIYIYISINFYRATTYKENQPAWTQYFFSSLRGYCMVWCRRKGLKWSASNAKSSLRRYKFSILSLLWQKYPCNLLNGRSAFCRTIKFSNARCVSHVSHTVFTFIQFVRDVSCRRNPS